MASGEVVGAVEHHVGARHLGLERLTLEPRLNRLQARLRVESMQRGARQATLAGLPCGPVHDLALQVGEIDRVVVASTTVPTPAAARYIAAGEPTRTRADDQRARVEQRLLALHVISGSRMWLAVAQQLVVTSSPVDPARLFVFAQFERVSLWSPWRGGPRPG